MQWKKVVAISLLISIGVGFVNPNQLVAEEWGQGPLFMADKTDVCVGELVTFDNLTTGGTHPYSKAEWDFNSDGIIDTTLAGTESEVMADVTWAYDEPGVYTVSLWMIDTTPTSRYEERSNYITVGVKTWTFLAAGFFPKHLPDVYTGQIVLADLDPADIPAQVQGVWWYDGLARSWDFWVPSVGGELATLGGGHTYDYLVLVTGECEWEIP